MGVRRIVGRGGLVALALVAVLGVVTRPARSAPAGDREGERTTLYRQGVAAADSGHWAEALEKFRQVLAIRSAPTVLFSLAQAADHVGLLATAENAYLQALADARQAGMADVAGAAGSALAGLTPRVPRLVVRVAPESATQVEVLLDGVAVSPGTPIGADPGDHLVVVRAATMKEFQQHVALQPRQVFELAVNLEADAPGSGAPLPAPAPGPPATASPLPHAESDKAVGHRPSSSFPIGPVVTMGAGVVVAIAGLSIRVVEQSAYDNADCPNAMCASTDAANRANSARGWIIGGTVALGVGAAAVAGGALWWVLGGANSNARVAVTLRSTPGGAVAGAFGSF